MINEPERNRKRFGLPKTERIYLREEIRGLYEHGEAFIAYPLRVVFCLSLSPRNVRCSIMTSVPKRLFKRAVKRNRIKRLMREAYRLNKESWIDFLTAHDLYALVSFSMVGDTLPDANTMTQAIKKALNKLEDRLGNA